MRAVVTSASCLALVALASPGCGDSASTTTRESTTPRVSSTTETSAASSTTTTASLPTPAQHELPDAAAVNTWFSYILDSAAPKAQRAKLFAGVSADPDFADTFAAGARAHGLAVQTRQVRGFAGGATADATIMIDGSKTPDGGSVLLEKESGEWRISAQWSCAMLSVFDVTSPAC